MDEYPDIEEEVTYKDRLSRLVERAFEISKSIEDAESGIESLKREQKELLEVTIPSIMDEAGISQITTTTGLVVKVLPYVSANIGAKWPESKRQEAFEYLRNIGAEDLIKHELVAVFGRNEDERAVEARKALERYADNVKDKMSVHPQTLSAWAREQIENGVQLLSDKIGLFTGRTTKITTSR